jgi:leader peptidase (prepilin peptidase)/N-methyltransferase
MILSLIKLGVLIALLLYASIKDIKSREVPDSVSGMMLILGLVGITAGDLPSMLLGMVLVFLPQYLAAIINPEKALGGADIKLSSVAAFLLGAPRGLFALIVGLTLSVITVPIVRKVKKLPKNQPFPLVPFLAVGIIAAYLI